MIEVIEFPKEKTAAARLNEGQQTIVDALKRTLVRAEAGELSGVGIAYVLDTGATVQLWACPWMGHALMAAISYLQHRYAKHQLAPAEPFD